MLETASVYLPGVLMMYAPTITRIVRLYPGRATCFATSSACVVSINSTLSKMSTDAGVRDKNPDVEPRHEGFI